MAERARPSTRQVARRRIDAPRVIAWRTLRAVSADDAYANLVLPKLLRESGLHGRDAAFATELAYGALRGQGTYDAVLAACAHREIDPPLLDALRLGAHQLLATRVATHAAVAATVDLVRSEIGQGAAGFANAVLRRVSERDLAGWLTELAPPDEDARLALTHSHPEWIVRALRDALRHHGRPAAELEQLLAADNRAPEVTVAALPGLASPDELHGVPGMLSPYAVRITGAPGALPAIRQGRARVQDEGSQVVALALADAPLEGADQGAWLDLCAGPGGKAALLASVLAGRRARGEVPGQARLTATELAPHRVELVRAALAGVQRADSAARADGADGATDANGGASPIVEVLQLDGREAADELVRPGQAGEGFDRVLVDAPCTGLGALRRRPEARWRRTPADLAGLAPLQRALLRAALDVVRPGGVVGYVTCSPHPAETTMVVDDVLRRLGADVVERVAPDQQLWPHRDGTDAMYLALLRRVPSTGPDHPTQGASGT
ncbi:MAG: hypothetical protein IPK24_13855 [Kineosporiaceae bacterium]|nr:hypothetical protein [Kineosporiaceae bacterium]